MVVHTEELYLVFEIIRQKRKGKNIWRQSELLNVEDGIISAPFYYFFYYIKKKEVDTNQDSLSGRIKQRPSNGPLLISWFISNKPGVFWAWFFVVCSWTHYNGYTSFPYILMLLWTEYRTHTQHITIIK